MTSRNVFCKLAIFLMVALILLPVSAFAEENPGSSAEQWLLIGKHLFFEKKYDASIAAFTKALSLDPKLQEAYYCRSSVNFFLNDYNSAAKDLSEIIKLDPRQKVAYNGRAVCYRRLGYYDLAMADWTKVIELDPKDPLVYLNRGNLYGIQKKYQLSINDSETALKLTTKSEVTGMARFNLAQALELTGKKAEALEEYRLAQPLLLEENILEKAKAEARLNGNWETFRQWI